MVGAVITLAVLSLVPYRVAAENTHQGRAAFILPGAP
jgi:hypothetical protein